MGGSEKVFFNGTGTSHRQCEQYIFASAICGAVSAVVMNRERMRVNDDTGLIAAQLTGWFWLSLIAALVITASGIALFLRRRTN